MRIARRVRPAAAALLAGAGLATSLLVASPASAGEILSVKGETANFREGPGEKHPILFAADRFYPVEVLQTKDGWSKIRDFEGDEAWVAARLLSKQETVVVEEDRVNVRDGSSTSDEIVFKAERGEVFKVEERQGKWLKVVDASGDGGWIRDDMVWGERGVAAASSKGKTKGELDGAGSAGKGDGKPEGSKGKAAPRKAKPKAEDDAAAEAKPAADAPAADAPAATDAKPAAAEAEPQANAPADEPEPKRDAKPAAAEEAEVDETPAADEPEEKTAPEAAAEAEPDDEAEPDAEPEGDGKAEG